ncbi:MAG: excisionase family DNA-binding protein [Parvularculaceae bacterium]
MLAHLDQRESMAVSAAEAAMAERAARILRPIAASQQDIRVVVDNDSKVVVPLPARIVALIQNALETIAERVPVSLIPHDAELTTQQAADFLNVSRPYLVSLLDKGLIDHRMVGAHRRIRYGDLLRYEAQSKQERRKAIEAMIAESRNLGLE